MKMTRRELFEGIGSLTLAAGMRSIAEAVEVPSASLQGENGPLRLAGTEAFTMEGDIAANMVMGIHADLLQRNEASVEARAKLWSPDYSSRGNYEASVAANRERFAKVIGLIDERISYTSPNVEMRLGDSPVVATGEGYRVYNVCWPVLGGVNAEGLLLEPDGRVTAQVVALPDADWSPEMLVGIESGIEPEAHFARHLAENGCRVLVPVLIDRKDTWSGNEKLGIHTNLTHREFIYRMAYEMGRHVIGYEVQKVLAAVDWFAKSTPQTGIGVIGYGEGALLALYSAAVDRRIDAACVSGYFTSRQKLWQEPLYRNVWTLLHEFGDAEIASLIAPRTLIVEASRGPEISGPPPAVDGHRKCAASGSLVSPTLIDVRAEVERARPVFAKLRAGNHLFCVPCDEGRGNPGSPEALRVFLRALGVRGQFKPSGDAPANARTSLEVSERMHRQLTQLVEFSQHAVIESESVRNQFWKKADPSSVEQWQRSAEFYRNYLWEEIFGKLPDVEENTPAQTRRLYVQPNWTGYEVFLPMWGEVFA
ncbi:MAG TPA: dienelactone hydrolase family protein, partial [Terriglobales bacterium]|nr:dienelactone hydrolase family protein [Terriglobales bacterium]